jgi:phosphotransferase system IIA component
LLECDLNAIKAEGYNTITPVIVTNSDDYENVGISPFGDNVGVGEMILDIN